MLKQKPHRLTPDRSILFVCDIQEAFRKALRAGPVKEIVSRTQFLLDTSTELGIPIVVTEQYPKGLGHTLEEIKIPDGTPVMEKTSFSMVTEEVQQLLSEKYSERDTILLCGVESHVCVFQTCMDLIESGYKVHILKDAVRSIDVRDKDAAMARFTQTEGVFISSSQMAAFDLIRDKKHESFKAVSKGVKKMIE